MNVLWKLMLLLFCSRNRINSLLKNVFTTPKGFFLIIRKQSTLYLMLQNTQPFREQPCIAAAAALKPGWTNYSWYANTLPTFSRWVRSSTLEVAQLEKPLSAAEKGQKVHFSRKSEDHECQECLTCAWCTHVICKLFIQSSPWFRISNFHHNGTHRTGSSI